MRSRIWVLYLILSLLMLGLSCFYPHATVELAVLGGLFGFTAWVGTRRPVERIKVCFEVRSGIRPWLAKGTTIAELRRSLGISSHDLAWVDGEVVGEEYEPKEGEMIIFGK